MKKICLFLVIFSLGSSCYGSLKTQLFWPRYEREHTVRPLLEMMKQYQQDTYHNTQDTTEVTWRRRYHARAGIEQFARTQENDLKHLKDSWQRTNRSDVRLSAAEDLLTKVQKLRKKIGEELFKKDKNIPQQDLQDAIALQKEVADYSYSVKEQSADHNEEKDVIEEQAEQPVRGTIEVCLNPSQSPVSLLGLDFLDLKRTMAEDLRKDSLPMRKLLLRSVLLAGAIAFFPVSYFLKH